MTAPAEVQIMVRVGDPALPDDERAELSRALARQVQAIDGVNEAALATDEAPERAKAIEGFTWGALILALAPVAVTEVIAFLKDWSKRPGGQPTKITVQVGDRAIAVDYDPARMTPGEIEDLSKRLRDLIDG